LSCLHLQRLFHFYRATACNATHGIAKAFLMLTTFIPNRYELRETHLTEDTIPHKVKSKIEMIRYWRWSICRAQH